MATPTSLPATFVAGNVLTAAQMNALRGSFRILQVASTTKTDTFSASVASAGTTSVTGLSVSITPSSTSSTIFVMASVAGCTVAGGDKPGTSFFQLTAAGSPILVGAAASNRTQLSAASLGLLSNQGFQTATMQGIHSPATTSSVTYGVDVFNVIGVTATVYVNRGPDDTDVALNPRTISTITVMEVSA